MFAGGIYAILDGLIYEGRIDRIDIGDLLANSILALGFFLTARWCGRALRISK
jgi:hypothetical protein